MTGYGQDSTYAQRGFLWSNGTFTDLGLNLFAAALNDNDVIVGSNQIWSNGIRQDLDNLIPAGSGYQINYATGINDNGQIVADAPNGSHYGNAVLLTPN